MNLVRKFQLKTPFKSLDIMILIERNLNRLIEIRHEGTPQHTHSYCTKKVC